MTDAIKGGEIVVRTIYERDGEVRASVLVDEARPKSSPAHPFFEWKDSVAAQEYRLIQARKLIKRVVVEIEGREERLVHVPRVTTAQDSKEGYYKPVSVVVESPTEFELALSEATAKLGSARRSVDRLRYAAEKLSDTDDRAAMISQVAKGLELLEYALHRVEH